MAERKQQPPPKQPERSAFHRFLIGLFRDAKKAADERGKKRDAPGKKR